MPRKPKDPIKELLNHHDAPAPFLSWALDYLKYYGYLTSDAPEVTEVEVATRDFQVMAGIDADGVIGPQTLETMWLPRCGCRDDSITETARWRQRELTYYVESYLEGLSNLSRADQDDIQRQVFTHYEANIDVKWTRVSNRNQANLIIGTGEGRGDGFDGPGGVLAWCQLPNGSISQIVMKFDRSDSWHKVNAGQRGILYPNVLAHELGHGHGMLHINGPLALLNPIYNASVGTLLQPDVAALLALGYPKATAPTQPPAGQTRTTIELKFDPGTVPNFKCLVSKGAALQEIQTVTES